MKYKITGWLRDEGVEVSWESSKFEFPSADIDITKRYSKEDMDKWNIFNIDQHMDNNSLLDKPASYEVTHQDTGFTWLFDGILNSKDLGTLTLYGKMYYYVTEEVGT